VRTAFKPCSPQQARATHSTTRTSTAEHRPHSDPHKKHKTPHSKISRHGTFAPSRLPHPGHIGPLTLDTAFPLPKARYKKKGRIPSSASCSAMCRMTPLVSSVGHVHACSCFPHSQPRWSGTTANGGYCEIVGVRDWDGWIGVEGQG
jgi:hypothetical protein